MTVNERLWLSELFDEFEKSIAQGDKAKLKSILEKVHLDSETIEATIEHVLSKNLNDVSS